MADRLQKLLAKAGYGSRRQCETLIAAGRVCVNGKRAHVGQSADSLKDRVEVDGKRIKLAPPIYIKLYKPKGVLSSTSDELNRGRPTWRELIEIPGHLFPVGRLDKQSEGLMLLTNDGSLTHRLTHPRYEHKKVYEVTLEGHIPADALEQWRAGVFLDDKLTAPASIVVVSKQAGYTKLRIILREGRKRQIRRIAASFGHPVTRLLRSQIGPVELGNLRPGEWRYLTDQEVAELRQSVTGRTSKTPNQ